MEYKPGSRWKSAVCSSEIVVVRPPKSEGELTCGGAPMVPHDAAAPAGDLDPAWSGGLSIGKRYVDDASGIEVLGAKAGKGSLAYGGQPLRLKEAKPLPASD
jgi:hypothetical protein